jgi:hypothetical protein
VVDYESLNSLSSLPIFSQTLPPSVKSNSIPISVRIAVSGFLIGLLDMHGRRSLSFF